MIELHLHLDGALRPKTVWELAQLQQVNLPSRSIEETKEMMEVPENCKTLSEYLERFDLPLLVLQQEEAIERVAYELVEDLVKLSVEYAEIRFAPQLSTKKGLSQEQVVEAAIRGVQRGMKEYPSIRVGLILCCMRGDDLVYENMETIEVAHKYLGDVVCAVDLAGAESLFATDLFEDVFTKASMYKIPMTIHAGEADGPESIWKALSYGTKRIGHGIAAIQDPKLIEKLIEDQVTLEICVTSNVHTKVVESLEAHPVRKLFDAGVRVTINSDNMTVSDTNIWKEKEIVKQAFHFTEEEWKQMEQYAKEAA
ncbi:MAG: adenosine deaminase, partial [Firmicutes bacterium]|nr:adenosine deaminase [Candidatus Scybalomonas excrementavium]